MRVSKSIMRVSMGKYKKYKKYKGKYKIKWMRVLLLMMLLWQRS